MNEKPKLRSLHINSYALAQGALTMAFTVQVLYLTLFMTEYLGISPAMVGTAMLIAKTADFLISLVAGIIIEKTNFKKSGRYIGWLGLLTGTLFFGMLIQMFNTTPFVGNVTVRAIIVCIGYIMFHGSMNFNATARGCLIPKMCGADMEARKTLTARQSQVGAVVSIVGSAIILPIITKAGSIFGEAWGYFAATVFFSTVFLICQLVFLKVDGPFDPAGDAASRKVPSVKEMIASIFTNKQLLLLVFCASLYTIGSQIYTGLTAYYFKVVTGQFQMMTPALTARSIVGFIASLFVPALARKMGKKSAMVVGWSIYAIATFIAYAFGMNMWMFIGAMCLAQAATYIYQALMANYYLDCGEYGYYTTGKDNRAIAMTVMNFPTKIGFAIGGALVGYGLDWAGYSAGMQVTEAFTKKYMMVVGLFPAIFIVVAAVLGFIFYRLTDEQAKMYAEANAKRDRGEA